MYKIANLLFHIDSLTLKGTNALDCLVPFSTAQSFCDVTYHINYTDKLDPPDPEDIVYYTEAFLVSRNLQTFSFYHIARGTVFALCKRETISDYQITITKAYADTDFHRYFVPGLLHLELPLLWKNNMVLHSLFITFGEAAILFSGPSGIGKSTQAELWKQYKHAEIINGDKSIIGKENGQWNAYGLPFSGSSEYRRNKTCPLKAIVLLDQGIKNTFLPVGLQGFSRILSQITQNPWEKEFCNRVMDLTMDLCKEIPVYYYSCTKTPEAVEILYQEFTEKGIINGSF